jgi:colicin import membrane protein
MGSVSTTDTAGEDVALIMDGGENFVRRLTALQQTKKGMETAFQELNIGLDARRAYDDANARQAQSVKDLDEARARATAIVREAEAQSAAIMQAAEKVKAETDAYASRIIHEAEGVAADMKTKAETTLAEAEEEKDKIRKLKAQWDAARAELTKRTAEANAKTKAAEATRAMLAKKLKALEQAVAAAAAK